VLFEKNFASHFDIECCDLPEPLLFRQIRLEIVTGISLARYLHHPLGECDVYMNVLFQSYNPVDLSDSFRAVPYGYALSVLGL